MPALTIVGRDVLKRYTQRPVFRPVSFEAMPGEIIAITGPNGSGKSTLLKIIAHVLSPSKGSIEWCDGDKTLDHDEIRVRLGYVAPYLELYDELTALEHVVLVGELKGRPVKRDTALELLLRFGLDENVAKSERNLKAYSSGMKQRVRCAMALAGNPEVLLLDEPTTNLDEGGTEAVLREAKNAAGRSMIVFLATNEERERAIASREIRLELA